MGVPTIYIVDDEAGVLSAIRRLLRPIGSPVLVFCSAEEFLAACDPDTRGCLVLDVGLPGMSGIELHERMSAERWQLPVVFLTSRFDPSLRDAALRRGAVAYLHKPSGLDQLQSHVAGIMAAAPSSAGGAASPGAA
jgi:two-component system response regulator FixJ